VSSFDREKDGSSSEDEVDLRIRAKLTEESFPKEGSLWRSGESSDAGYALTSGMSLRRSVKVNVPLVGSDSDGDEYDHGTETLPLWLVIEYTQDSVTSLDYDCSQGLMALAWLQVGFGGDWIQELARLVQLEPSIMGGIYVTGICMMKELETPFDSIVMNVGLFLAKLARIGSSKDYVSMHRKKYKYPVTGHLYAAFIDLPWFGFASELVYLGGDVFKSPIIPNHGRESHTVSEYQECLRFIANPDNLGVVGKMVLDRIHGPGKGLVYDGDVTTGLFNPLLDEAMDVGKVFAALQKKLMMAANMFGGYLMKKFTYDGAGTLKTREIADLSRVKMSLTEESAEMRVFRLVSGGLFGYRELGELDELQLRNILLANESVYGSMRKRGTTDYFAIIGWDIYSFSFKGKHGRSGKLESISRIVLDA
jgi:hypothetical protein